MICYVVGDATRPLGDGPRIVAHICNDAGGWRTGFVRSLSRRWYEPEHHYLALAASGNLHLGFTEFVSVEDDIWVANMIAQSGDGRSAPRVLSFEHLEQTLRNVAVAARVARASVHMPLIGAGLGGQSWDLIEPVIERTCGRLPVVIYDPA